MNSYEIETFFGGQSQGTKTYSVAFLRKAGVTEGTASLPFQVTFTGLPPGAYSFVVTAVNKNGKASAGATQAVTVKGEGALGGRAVGRCRVGEAGRWQAACDHAFAAASGAWQADARTFPLPAPAAEPAPSKPAIASATPLETGFGISVAVLKPTVGA